MASTKKIIHSFLRISTITCWWPYTSAETCGNKYIQYMIIVVMCYSDHVVDIHVTHATGWWYIKETKVTGCDVIVALLQQHGLLMRNADSGMWQRVARQKFAQVPEILAFCNFGHIDDGGKLLVKSLKSLTNQATEHSSQSRHRWRNLAYDKEGGWGIDHGY